MCALTKVEYEKVNSCKSLKEIMGYLKWKTMKALIKYLDDSKQLLITIEIKGNNSQGVQKPEEAFHGRTSWLLKLNEDEGQRKGRSTLYEKERRIQMKESLQKTKVKWFTISAKNLDTTSLNVLAWRRRNRRRKISPSLGRRKDGETNICLMVVLLQKEKKMTKIIFKQLIKNTFQNSSTLSIVYKDLKKKFSKLSKQFDA
ncbi:hypothetical protein CR513_53360, partial [Mucuna pruriens]